MANILYDNCFITSYQSEVKEVVEENGFYWHNLEETIFHQGMCGVDPDEGLINQHRVLKLKKEDDKVWHLLDVKLEGKVTLSVDFHLRFSHAQVHTAQHLLCGIMESVYGCKMLSHQWNGNYNEIEFATDQISERKIHELQVIVNGLIRDDLKVKIFYPTKMEMANYAIDNPGLYDEVRMVSIGDITTKPCTNIHIPSLRYLQMVKINGCEKTEKGVKIMFVCGDQLLNNYDRYYESLKKASKLLAQPFDFIELGILKLVMENNTQKADMALLRTKYVEALAQGMDWSKKQYRVYDDMDIRTFLLFVNECAKISNNDFILLWKQEKRMHIALYSVCGNAMQQWHEILDGYAISGNGNEYLMQGGSSYKEEIEDYLSKKIEEIEISMI